MSAEKARRSKSRRSQDAASPPRRRADEALKEREQEIARLASFPQLNPNPVLEVDYEGQVTFANAASLEALANLGVPGKVKRFLPTDLEEILKTAQETGENKFYREIEINGAVFGEYIYHAPQFQVMRLYATDITESRERQREVAALLTATRAVLESRDFPAIARTIFDSCKELIGATAGYVALLSKDGQENEVLFLESGGLTCRVDPSLPMPIRGLRQEAYRRCQAVYDNDFSKSKWTRLLPPGHVTLHNVLFAPMVIQGKAVGLLGLANKPGGFTENDARLAAGFGELAAVAFSNRQTEEERERLIQELETERGRLVAIIESAPEGIAVADADCRIVLANPAVEQLYLWPGLRPKDADRCLLAQYCHGDGTPCEYQDRPLIRSVLEGEAHRNREMAIIWPDGQRRDLLVNTAPIRDSQGRVAGAVGLYQDITAAKAGQRERERLLRELERRVQEVSLRTAQLEAANRELEAFSYSVSHDLRAPLRAIEGFSHIMAAEYASRLDEEGARLLQVIQDNTQFMGQLIDDLLVLSRLGRQELRLMEFDLEALVKAAFAELTAPAPARDLQLTCQGLPRAWGDRALIKQVLANLLANALKFTTPRAQAVIEVGGSTEGGENIYYVRDNGVGFDMRYAHKLFGVFQRLHRSEEFPGTGVGLAIVQRLIQRHGGRVWASGKIDGGACFYFTLPRRGE